jgi:hypothetical protein
MKAWFFVEGESGRTALEALFRPWNERLRQSHDGIQVVPIKGKSRFLIEIGSRVAQRLVASPTDIVVAAPDLHPMRDFDHTPFPHSNVAELATLMRNSVRSGLILEQRILAPQADQLLDRFLPSALKYDLEFLLLAARKALKQTLGTAENLGNWRRPVEEQNDDTPPKRIVEDLFLRKSKKRRAYQETVDAAAVLRRVTDIREVLFEENGQLQCPLFKSVLDWMGGHLGTLAY